ncbi:Protein kinase domain-containing protein [Caenorhabditis elegans]|nr:Protein kinase domain-containing protein [Caenorhabditis elegans]CTQ86491.1 Protein kinase domain-containing protein [Caenorhabditis elegans]|eukprot:NP_001300552.1 Uncharacterized protein CELE_F54H5.2 [Caenorhabditis elegans]
MLLISIMSKGKFSWNDPFDWEMPISTPPSKSITKSPNQLSKETIKKASREKTLSKEKTSKEDIKTAQKTSIEKDVKEKLSKEMASKEKISLSAEKINMSAEKIEEDNKKEEYMRMLPFDPDFFASDPIGF